MARWHISKRYVAFTLALLSCLTAVGFVLAAPVRGTITAEGPQGVMLVQHEWSTFWLVLVVLQLTAAVLTLAAAVCVLRDRTSVAQRLLLAGGLAGLLPVPVTAAFAGGAYLLLRKSAKQD
jgi:hypothetical protein